MSFDKSNAAAMRQRRPDGRGPLVPTGGSEYLVYQARNTAAQEQTAEHAKETMLAGTPGAGLFQSIVTIRGYAPIPLGSDRHVHAAAVEVRRVKGSNAVELEKQTQQIRASPLEVSSKATYNDRLRESFTASPVAIPYTTRIEGFGQVL